MSDGGQAQESESFVNAAIMTPPALVGQMYPRQRLLDDRGTIEQLKAQVKELAKVRRRRPNSRLHKQCPVGAVPSCKPRAFVLPPSPSAGTSLRGVQKRERTTMQLFAENTDLRSNLDEHKLDGLQAYQLTNPGYEANADLVLKCAQAEARADLLESSLKQALETEQARASKLRRADVEVQNLQASLQEELSRQQAFMQVKAQAMAERESSALDSVRAEKAQLQGLVGKLLVMINRLEKELEQVTSEFQQFAANVKDKSRGTEEILGYAWQMICDLGARQEVTKQSEPNSKPCAAAAGVMLTEVAEPGDPQPKRCFDAGVILKDLQVLLDGVRVQRIVNDGRRQEAHILTLGSYFTPGIRRLVERGNPADDSIRPRPSSSSRWSTATLKVREAVRKKAFSLSSLTPRLPRRLFQDDSDSDDETETEVSDSVANESKSGDDMSDAVRSCAPPTTAPLNASSGVWFVWKNPSSRAAALDGCDVADIVDVSHAQACRAFTLRPGMPANLFVSIATRSHCLDLICGSAADAAALVRALLRLRAEAQPPCASPMTLSEEAEVPESSRRSSETSLAVSVSPPQIQEWGGQSMPALRSAGHIEHFKPDKIARMPHEQVEEKVNVDEVVFELA